LILLHLLAAVAVVMTLMFLLLAVQAAVKEHLWEVVVQVTLQAQAHHKVIAVVALVVALLHMVAVVVVEQAQ
jgi:hypothetical protein